MAVYKCSVINKEGKKQKFNRYAVSRSELMGYLKQNNYIIIDTIKSESFINQLLYKNTKIKSKDIAIFCKQLYAMLTAGVTIADSIKILKYQTENKSFAKIVESLHENLHKGNTFSKSLSIYKNVFPPILIKMVEAGEISGNLEVIMNRLSIHFEKEYKIENRVKSAMTYPIILIFVSIVVVIFLLTAIMPTFVQIYINSNIELPKSTQFIIYMSKNIKNNWHILILFAFALVIILSAISKNNNIAYKIDYCKLKIPIMNNLVLKIACSRFARTLSTLLGSGVQMLQAIETTAGVIGNAYLGKQIIEIKEDVKRGQTLSQSLLNQGIFPPMVYSMIRIGEDSNTMEEILDKTADFCDEEVDSTINKLTSLVEPLMIVLMAVIIGFIVIAMVTPMFDMIQIIQ